MRRQARPETVQGEEATAKRGRLLLLDDEESILQPLKGYFEEIGYSVVATTEPEEAEALLDYEVFDLVLLDLALTRFGREGLEVFGSIRARNPFLPVIVLSANVSADVEEEARRLHACAVLSKPQPLGELAAIVARCMGKAA